MIDAKRFFYRERVLFNMLPIGAGIAAFYLTPGKSLSGGTFMAGLVVLGIGFLLRFWVSAYNWANINSPQPEASHGIITAGPYARCRNPIYLSAIILVTGFSMIFNWWLISLLMIVPTILLHLWQIRYEERYLQNLWPESFFDYKKKVPSLIPYHFKKVDVPLQGKPNWKKAIKTDTGPLAGVFIFILVILALLPFFGYGRGVLTATMGITIVIDMIIVGKVKKGKSKIEKTTEIPATAPPFILDNLLRKAIYPPQRLIKKIITPSPPRHHQTILDFGCGPGFYTLPTAKALGKNGKVIAVDVRQKMLGIIKRKANRKGLKNIDYIENSTFPSSRLSFPNNSIDIALLFMVLGELIEPGLTCAEIKRVLKPKGMIYILENKFDDHYLTMEEVALLFSSEFWEIKVLEQGKSQYLLELHQKSYKNKK